MGGADQSTEPDEVTCGNVVEGEIVAGLEPGRDLAKFGRLPNGSDEPLPVWTQLAEQWQKASAEAMTFWAKGGRPADAGGPRRR